MTWPDLVVGGVVLLFVLKGWKRGFVAEIGGFIALAAAFWAALRYPGTFDGPLRDWTHLGAGSAHVVGMAAFAGCVYVALLVVSSALGRIARLPVIGIGNGIGGAAVGCFKALLGLWVVLYAALFFPLGKDVRADLHASRGVAFVTQENDRVDDLVRGTMPWFVRPLVGPLFEHHRL